jgi:hypothetical protein
MLKTHCLLINSVLVWVPFILVSPIGEFFPISNPVNIRDMSIDITMPDRNTNRSTSYIALSFLLTVIRISKPAKEATEISKNLTVLVSYIPTTAKFVDTSSTFPFWMKHFRNEIR